MPGKLSVYRAKRNFNITSEPRGEVAAPSERLRFVVQKHDARRLHYDFRLELDGTLKSWAVPKGPSLDPSDKRLAVQVEDHPLGYIGFEGVIPEHQYGAGVVEVWDTGHWEPQGDPSAGYRAGKLKFRLDGEKLQGGWMLVRTRLQAGGGKQQWLLIKEKDEQARSGKEFDITAEMPDSVVAARGGKAPGGKARRPTASSDRAGKADGSARSAAAKSRPGDLPDPSALEYAVKAPLPEMLNAQLATLVDTVPEQGNWVYEVKFDGYRVLARIRKGKVELFTRDGKNWTARLAQQAAAIEALGLDSGWLDGEIVVLDQHDIPSFQLLQNAFDAKRSAQILYFLFDLPYLNGYDLRNAPLSQRRPLLEQLLARLPEQGPLRYSAPMQQPPHKLLDSACRLSMEGIIGKLIDSPYVGKRSADWIKLKCRKRQEFVIAGYTDPQGARKFFGSLLLAVYGDDGALRYAGRVGTGFDQTVLQSVFKHMKSLRQKDCPLDRSPAGVSAVHTHWIKPTLAAEISFAEWTKEGRLRQAVFHGLRLDKPAAQIRREEAAPAPGKAAASRNAHRLKNSGPQNSSVQGVEITNPDRVIDAASGLTKLDLARYYEQVAPALLPYLRSRPVYLLRFPEGVGGEQFFHKHPGRIPIPGVTTLDPALDPGLGALMVIGSPHALAGAAQMGTIELHICSATADRIDRPDCMVFDLDPDPALPWTAVVEGARLTKVLLDELGLRSFLKTSGGKGLHLFVPLARRHTWEAVADFSEAVVQHLARAIPDRFSAKMGEKNRVGKIYVDYLRNQKAASTVAPYSARARPGLPVSTPIGWDELDHTTGAAMWTVATLPERLAGLQRDPWSDYFRTRQALTEAMKKKIGMPKK